MVDHIESEKAGVALTDGKIAFNVSMNEGDDGAVEPPAMSILPFSTISGMFEHLDGLASDANVPEASLYRDKWAFLEARATRRPRLSLQKLITEIFAVAK